MNVETLKKLIASGMLIKILDVREKEEYETAEKMEGAENIPMGQVFLEVGKGNLTKDQKIVTVCKSGMRCEIVARELKQKGFDIEALEGGVQAWNQS